MTAPRVPLTVPAAPTSAPPITVTAPRPVAPPESDWRFGPSNELDRTVKGATQTPEQATRVLDLQRRTGYREAFIRDNLDTLEAATKGPDFDPIRFAEQSPISAAWMAQTQERTVLLGRDWSRLGVLERQARNIAANFRTGVQQTELMRIGEAVLMGTATPEQRTRQRELEVAAGNAPTFGVEGFFEEALGAAAQQVPIYARTLKASGVGGAAGAAAGAAVGAAVGRNPAAVSAGARVGLGFGAKAAAVADVALMEASSAMLEYEKLTDPNGEPLDVETARGAALIAGALSGSLEAVSLGQLVPLVPGLGKMMRPQVRALLTGPTTRGVMLAYAKQLGKSMATEGLTETLQSLITQGGGVVAQAATDGRLQSDPMGVLRDLFADPEAWQQAVAEGRAGAQASLVLGGGLGSVSLGLDLRAASRAERTATALEAVAENVAEAKSVVDAPEEVVSLMTELHQSGLTGVTYTVKDWQELWQSVTDENGQPVDPRAAALEVLGEQVTVYDQAASVAPETPFEVPMGVWATRMARNPVVRTFAIDFARAGTAAMSRKESREQTANMDAVLTELMDTIVAAKQEAKPVEEMAASLAARVEQEVTQAGRPAREAALAGQVWASVYRAWSQSSGTDAASLMAMFARARTVSPAAEAAAAKQRAELAAFVSDEATTEEVSAYPGQRDAALEADAVAADEAAAAEALALGRTRPATAKTGAVKSVLTRASDESLVATYIEMRDRLQQAEMEVESADADPAFARAMELAGVGRWEEAQGAYEEAGGSGAVWTVQERVKMLDAARALIAKQTPGLARLEVEMARRGLNPDEVNAAGEFDASMFAQSMFPERTTPESEAEVAVGEMVARQRSVVARARQALINAGRLTPDEVTVLEQAAFHGTPHIFDRFSTAKMGTGEGAQAYGWGLYFAENEGIAAGYKESLSPTWLMLNGKRAQTLNPRGFSEMPDFVRKLKPAPGDTGDIKSLIRDYLRVGSWSALRVEREQMLPMFAEKYEALIAKYDIENRVTVEAQGALYRVDISDAAVATFLDWDKPLSEQAPEVRKAYFGIVADIGFPASDALYADRTRYSIMGADAYSRLSDWMGGQESASKALLAAGIRGIKYLDAGSRGSTKWVVAFSDGTTAQYDSEAMANKAADTAERNGNPRPRVTEGTRNLVVFDENDVTITHRNGEPVTAAERADVLEQSGPEPRGRIFRSADRREFKIELLAKADPSTFLHESAHFFFSLMGNLAAEPNATEAIKADYAAAVEWAGGTLGVPLTVEQEERLARGFEAYLMEGKAPSLELRSAFARFAAWLTRLYRNLQALNVELTPEVRRVFDRMLATEDAIAEAESAQFRQPLIADAASVMTPDDAARYTEARTEARLAAEETLRAEVMRVVTREEQAWWKERKAEMRLEVEAEVHADPAYIARAVLTKGQSPDGTPLPADHPLKAKMDRKVLGQMIGEDALKALPNGVTRKSGGLHPDVVALALGYESGTALIEALAGTTAQKAHIDRLTQERMVAEHGDPLTDGTLPDKAMEAIHARQRDRVVRLELEHLARENPAALKAALRRIGGRLPSSEAVNDRARVMLAQRTLKQIRPIEWQRAEVAASKEAIKAALDGQWEQAFEAKLREQMSLALYRASVDAREEVAKAREMFARVFQADAKLGKTRDLNLVNAARALLANVGIGRAGKSAEDYLRSVREYDAPAAEEIESVLAASVPAREDSTDLTLEEFRTVAEQVNVLWHRAREDRTIEIDGVKMDLDEAEAALTLQVRTLPQSQFADAKFGDVPKLWDMAYEGGALLARMESIVKVLDGGEFNGPFRRTFFIPATNAATKMRAELTALWTKYLGLVEGLGTLTDVPIPAPMLSTPDRNGQRRPFQWKNKAHLLGAMLHTGNRTGEGSNQSKLLRGMGWDAAEWDAMVRDYQQRGVLTKADYDYLQGVWDLFEGVKPQAQTVFKKLYGYYFSEISADAVATPWGDYRGGYVPALRDPELVEEADARNQAKELESGITPETMPTTGKGFTNARTKAASPLLMDVRLVGTHLDATMRFIHLEPVARPLARLVRRKSLSNELDRVLPKAATRLFNPWLMRFTSQRLQKRGAWSLGDKMANWLRRVASGSFLYGNAANAAQNVVGVFPLLASGIKPTHLFAALRTYASGPKKMAEGIAALSPWMDQNQHDTMLDIVRDIRDRIESPSAFKSVQDFGYANGFVMSKMTQAAMDYVAWQARFNQAIEEGATQQNAIEQADSTVRTTQGARNPEDTAAYQVGSPVYQLAIMMSSWFNVQANLNTSEAAVTLNAVGLKKSAHRLAAIYIYGALLPSVLGEAVVRAMRGQGLDDPEDDEPWLLDLFQWAALAQVRYLNAFVPVFGQLANSLVNIFGTKEVYDDRITASPAISTVEASFRGAKELTLQALTDEELNRRDIRDIFTLLSILSDVPVAPLARPVQYLYDVREGTAEPSGPVDFGRGLLTGSSGAPRR